MTVVENEVGGSMNLFWPPLFKIAHSVFLFIEKWEGKVQSFSQINFGSEEGNSYFLNYIVFHSEPVFVVVLKSDLSFKSKRRLMA